MPNYSESNEDKNTNTDKNFTSQQPDSTTKVHFSGDSVPDYVSGVRKSTGVRIDTGVYNKFKPLSKRLYGSTCKAVETFMIGVIEVAEKGVHFSNTQQRVNIEKIVIERNLSRERRSLRVVSDVVKPQHAIADGKRCVVCGKVGFAWAIDKDGCRLLCETDFLSVKSRLLGWKHLEEIR